MLPAILMHARQAERREGHARLLVPVLLGGLYLDRVACRLVVRAYHGEAPLLRLVVMQHLDQLARLEAVVLQLRRSVLGILHLVRAVGHIWLLLHLERLLAVVRPLSLGRLPRRRRRLLRLVLLGLSLLRRALAIGAAAFLLAGRAHALELEPHLGVLRRVELLGGRADVRRNRPARRDGETAGALAPALLHLLPALPLLPLPLSLRRPRRAARAARAAWVVVGHRSR
mmetsp:Transcript_69587/g.185220  ORF Transcript_69587/g.185220 Transcript_69587/m.185220 type:complete len:228 (+) Transcript_69587:1974-2657(+)